MSEPRRGPSSALRAPFDSLRSLRAGSSPRSRGEKDAEGSAPRPAKRREGGRRPGEGLAPVVAALALTAVAAIAHAQTLDDVVARAIAHSPEVRALDAAVAEARANAVLGDAFRPAATLSTTPGYATGLPIAVLGQVPAIGTAEAHRLLYDPSSRAAQIGAASQIDAAVARRESRKREIARTVVELVARVDAEAALVASSQRRLTATETIAARTEALRREGRARDLDVARAALQDSTARRTATQARMRLDLDQLRLTGLVGEPVVWSAAAQPPLSTPPEGGGSAAALRNDPELRSLDNRIDALQRASTLENRLFQPSVAAQVQYSRLFDRFRRYYLNFKPDDFSVGATVTLPVWTGGHRAAASARLAAQLQQLVAERDARRTEMELTAREAEADATEAAAEHDLAVRAHKVAEESLRVAEETAREGRGEANDVPLAQIALADADDGIANAAAHLASARARLLIVRGELPREANSSGR